MAVTSARLRLRRGARTPETPGRQGRRDGKGAAPARQNAATRTGVREASTKTRATSTSCRPAKLGSGGRTGTSARGGRNRLAVSPAAIGLSGRSPADLAAVARLVIDRKEIGRRVTGRTGDRPQGNRPPGDRPYGDRPRGPNPSVQSLVAVGRSGASPAGTGLGVGSPVGRASRPAAIGLGVGNPADPAAVAPSAIGQGIGRRGTAHTAIGRVHRNPSVKAGAETLRFKAWCRSAVCWEASWAGQAAWRPSPQGVALDF